jgi:hypothetical protein
MKEQMFKYFTAINTSQYVDVLSDMVSRYNNTKPSSIRVTPGNASNPENIYRTYMNVYGDTVHDSSPKRKPKFVVIDEICLTKKQDTFRKGYLRRWT